MKFVILRNTLNAKPTWDVCEEGSPFPPCFHDSAQAALDCIIEHNGIRHFELEVRSR